MKEPQDAQARLLRHGFGVRVHRGGSEIIVPHRMSETASRHGHPITFAALPHASRAVALAPRRARCYDIVRLLVPTRRTTPTRFQD